MGTMNVSLPDDLIAYVREEAAGGTYGNSSDVVRDALRQLREQRRQRAVLCELVDAGREQLKAGDGVVLTDAVIDGIVERARKRADAKRRGAA